jgi:hypothetical protein
MVCVAQGRGGERAVSFSFAGSWTEIHLCHPCSCPEINNLEEETARQERRRREDEEDAMLDEQERAAEALRCRQVRVLWVRFG